MARKDEGARAARKAAIAEGWVDPKQRINPEAAMAEADAERRALDAMHRRADNAMKRRNDELVRRGEAQGKMPGITQRRWYAIAARSDFDDDYGDDFRRAVS